MELLVRFVCILLCKIEVSPGPYPASNSPPDCCIKNIQIWHAVSEKEKVL